MSAAKLRRHRDDLQAFLDALRALLRVLQPVELSYLSGPSWQPAAGNEALAAELRADVDRLAGRAADAFAAIPLWIDWKPPGTWQTQRVNPAQWWGTILGQSPAFQPDLVLSMGEQARGLLDGRLVDAEAENGDEGAGQSDSSAMTASQESSFFHKHRDALLITIIGGIVAGVVVALVTWPLHLIHFGSSSPALSHSSNTGPQAANGATPVAPAGGRTYLEIEGTLGVPTFSDPSTSGQGPKIPPNARVRVACKVYAPTIGSASPKGYWYLIASSPWRDHYVAVANTFLNGGTLSGRGVRYVDARVPTCR